MRSVVVRGHAADAIVRYAESEGMNLVVIGQHGHSRIALRVLTADVSEAIDEAFFSRRIGEAVRLRREWLGLDAVSQQDVSCTLDSVKDNVAIVSLTGKVAGAVGGVSTDINGATPLAGLAFRATSGMVRLVVL